MYYSYQGFDASLLRKLHYVSWRLRRVAIRTLPVDDLLLRLVFILDGRFCFLNNRRNLKKPIFAEPRQIDIWLCYPRRPKECIHLFPVYFLPILGSCYSISAGSIQSCRMAACSNLVLPYVGKYDLLFIEYWHFRSNCANNENSGLNSWLWSTYISRRSSPSPLSYWTILPAVWKTLQAAQSPLARQTVHRWNNSSRRCQTLGQFWQQCSRVRRWQRVLCRASFQTAATDCRLPARLS